VVDGIELTDVVVSNRKRHAVGSGRAADVGEKRVVDTVVRLVGAYVAAEIVVRKMAGTTSFDVPAVGAVPVLHTALHKEAGIALGGVLSPLPRIVVTRLRRDAAHNKNQSQNHGMTGRGTNALCSSFAFYPHLA
jgi:hypothetical protein